MLGPASVLQLLPPVRRVQHLMLLHLLFQHQLLYHNLLSHYLPPIKQEEDMRSPRSPDQGNIENVFPTSVSNPNGKRSVNILVSDECYLFSKPIGVACYLKPLASNKYWRKMDGVSA